MSITMKPSGYLCCSSDDKPLLLFGYDPRPGGLCGEGNHIECLYTKNELIRALREVMPLRMEMKLADYEGGEAHPSYREDELQVKKWNTCIDRMEFAIKLLERDG